LRAFKLDFEAWERPAGRLNVPLIPITVKVGHSLDDIEPLDTERPPFEVFSAEPSHCPRPSTPLHTPPRRPIGLRGTRLRPVLSRRRRKPRTLSRPSRSSPWLPGPGPLRRSAPTR